MSAGQEHPAGWYPAPGDPTRKRYWDGTQWTSQFQPGDGSPAILDGGVAVQELKQSAFFKPYSPTTVWHKRKPRPWVWVAIVLMLIIVGSVSGTQDGAGTSPAATAGGAPTSSPAVPESASLQEQFEAIVSKARDDYFAADTDLQEAEIYRLRDVALCDLLGDDFGAVGWVGEIERIGANGDGDAYVDISFGDDEIEVGTWSNIVSDAGFGTLVERGTPLHSTLLTLKRGDKVYFSGDFFGRGGGGGNDTCIASTRLSEDGALRDPAFLMRFWDVQPYSNAPYVPPERPSAPAASSSNAGSSTSTAPTSAPPFETVTLSGSGDSVVALPDLSGTPVVARLEHSGSRNFAIVSYDAAGSRIDLIVNDIGAFDGVVPLNFGDIPTELEITASGAWKVTISDLRDQPKLTATASGSGNDVLILDDYTGSLTATHDGDSNFVLRAFGGRFADLLVNDIGPYSGTRRVSSASAIEIIADGNWTLALG